MLRILLLFAISLIMCSANSDYYYPHNVSRTTLSGIAEYRSALTLDWLAHEDTRQRELALAFETVDDVPVQVLASDCINYGKPASGKVARLMLELLKNLEGDEGFLIPELIQALIRTKLLVETSLLEAEPDLDALVNTPGVMMGEPHTTFPRILAMTWMAVTDPTTVKKNGWCPISKVTKYLLMARPRMIAKQMRTLDPVISRARYVMEEFIQHVTPNIYEKQNLLFEKTKSMNTKYPMNRPTPKYYIHSKPTKKIRPYPAHQEFKQGSKPTTSSLPPMVSDRIEHNLIDEDMLFERFKAVNAAGVINLNPSVSLVFVNGLFVIKVYC